jgi:hypothetical protein
MTELREQCFRRARHLYELIADFGVDILHEADVTVVDLLVVQPKRSTLRSSAGFMAACSSRLRARAPTPPRFIGQRTWMFEILHRVMV